MSSRAGRQSPAEVRVTGSWATLLWLVASLVALSCKRAQPPGPAAAPAQLTHVEKQVQLEHQGRWQKATAGSPLSVGDALRTGPASSARLRFVRGGEIHLAERSLLRLGADADSSVHISIELGEAQIEGTGGLLVRTARGPARLEPGTQLRVTVDDEGARYEVIVGRALVGEGTEAVALGAGDGLAVRLGSSEMERYRVDVGTAEVEKAPSEPAAPSGPPASAAAGNGSGSPSPAGRAAEVAGPVDVNVPAGESAVLHGPHTPVVVRLRLPAPCPTSAVLSLEIAGRRRKQPLAQGETRVALPAGAHRYRVDCPGSRPVSGRLDVRRDSGHLRLVRRAPLNIIETDGRRYTVLYQNRLPALTLKWPGAARSGSYVLHVSMAGEEKRYPVSAPELHLASGALGDGAHSLWFSVDGGSRQSPRTAVTIRFDNAAVAAEIDRPRHGTRIDPDERVDVAGVALQGSSVAVGGAPLSIDEQGRFRGQVPPPAGDERSIAIRFQHPKGGVHYYIRRVEESR